MIFGLATETRNDPEYVRNIAFWLRRLFDMTQVASSDVSTSQTIAVMRTVYLVDTTSADVTITLPAASTVKGEWVAVKKTAAANSVIIDADGSETIDGSLTQTISGPLYPSLTLFSNGTNWYLI